jgi:primase-polymerase (primpol)-like protein
VSFLPNLDDLPVPILQSSRAVVWNFEERDGKQTKVPYMALRPSTRAAVNNPATWSSFMQACDAVADGNADGVGIVLGEGLIGVDLDHCRNPDSGEITADAWGIIRALDSYTEVSVSGAGTHVIASGELPAGGKRRRGIELYGDGRYFVVTGQHLAATPTTIEERTAALTTLYATLVRPEPVPDDHHNRRWSRRSPSWTMPRSWRRRRPHATGRRSARSGVAICRRSTMTTRPAIWHCAITWRSGPAGTWSGWIACSDRAP